MMHGQQNVKKRWEGEESVIMIGDGTQRKWMQIALAVEFWPHDDRSCKSEYPSLSYDST